jgi:hypothetical protein
MKHRTAGRRRLAALLLGVAMAASGTAIGAGATPPPNPDQDVLERLRAVETTGGAAVLVGANVQVGVAHPEEISLPISVFALDADQPVTVRSIRVTGPDGKTRAATRPEKRLASVAGTAPSLAGALDCLADRDRERARTFLARGLATPRIAVPVGDLELADGTTTTFTVTAAIEVAGAKKTAVLPIVATVAALPTASYWGAGDGHVHSSTWSDGWESLSWQVSDAKNNGHKWIIVTDHWKGIWAKAGRGDANWALYQDDCLVKEAEFRIPVVPGTEILAAKKQGHALAYALAPTRVPPRDEYLTPAELIAAIANHTAGASYSVIAHPYSALSDAWGDWSVTGLRAIELMSQERQASTSTQSRWFALMRAGLAAKLAGGQFVVGVANTDAHLAWQRPGEAGITWIRSAVTPLTRAAVLSAIRLGNASASGREDLGFFTINGVQQGGIAPASSTTALNFQITQKPKTGRKCTEISIRDSNNVAVWSVSNPSTTTYNTALAAPSASTFFVVKMVFAKTTDTDHSHVWCNPVFVDRK